MWVLKEPYSRVAEDIANQWARDRTDLIAPAFMLAEVTNAIYKSVRRSEISLDAAITFVDLVLGFGITLVEDPSLHREAIAIAHRFGRPSTYDAHYLALAERHGCDMWTGDERLYNAVREYDPGIRWIGTYQP
jgi:predicted nucleic acid-binding protein